MVVQGLLNDILGELVRLPRQGLKLDLLNGHVLLRNLEVQPAALQLLLGLPLVVLAGVVGRAELHIPWAKLGSEPARVQLDRVLLIVAPQCEEALLPCEHERSFRAKQRRLDAHEARRALSCDAAAAPKPQRGFFSKLAAKLQENLQLDLTNVVIRYADSSFGRSPFSVSLALDSLKLRKLEVAGAAEEGAAGGARAAGGLAKVVHLTGLSVCCAEAVPPPPPHCAAAACGAGPPSRRSLGEQSDASSSGSVTGSGRASGASSASRASGRKSGSRPAGGGTGGGPSAGAGSSRAEASDRLQWLKTHVEGWHRQATRARLPSLLARGLRVEVFGGRIRRSAGLPWCSSRSPLHSSCTPLPTCPAGRRRRARTASRSTSRG